MESPSIVQGVPFKQNPREGQRRVFEALKTNYQYLNIQLPTGYGKTFAAAGCYSIKKRGGDVNRLLIIFPSDAQLIQFEDDCGEDRSDLYKAGVDGRLGAVDIRFAGGVAIGDHQFDRKQVFVTTIQALIQPSGCDIIRRLMATGRWMVVVDEYHHYGVDKTWGRFVRQLPASFLLTMSATPNRPNDDSAFGKPHVSVSYREAVKEGAVKRLCGHSYHYRIDALADDGSIHSYTTSDLCNIVGSDAPEAIERFRIERKMRWSPKYVSPLVQIPIERMLRERIRTGHRRLQVLIGAMCVSHAELVCQQVSSMFPELQIDWVGTGTNGRTDKEIKAVIKRFCPPKEKDGRRHPELDILVHVGIAGEGLDATYITEVVHLNRASRNNSNDQENGRAARALKDAADLPVVGNINFDSSSDYAQFTGEAIMGAMDGLDSPTVQPVPEPGGGDNGGDFLPLPEEPAIIIYDLELEHIDSGDPEVQRMARVLDAGKCGFSLDDYLDSTSPHHQQAHQQALMAYRNMRRMEAEESNSKASICQWKELVETALGSVTSHVIRKTFGASQRAEKSLAGDLKKRINTKKKAALGEVKPDVEVYRKHYYWLRDLDKEVIQQGIPSWLS